MAKRWGAGSTPSYPHVARRHTRGRGYPGTHKNNRFSRAMMDNGVVCFLWVPASAGMTLTMCGMALMMCGNDGGYAGASPLHRPSGFRLLSE